MEYLKSEINHIYNKINQCIAKSPTAWSDENIKMMASGEDVLDAFGYLSPQDAQEDFLDAVLSGGRAMRQVLFNYPSLLNTLLSDDYGALILTLIALDGDKEHFDVLNDFGIDMHDAIYHSNYQTVPDVYDLDYRLTMGGVASFLGDESRIYDLMKWGVLKLDDVGIHGGYNRNEMSCIEVGLLNEDINVCLLFINTHLDEVNEFKSRSGAFNIKSTALGTLYQQKLLILNDKHEDSKKEKLDIIDRKINLVFDGYLSIYNQGTIKDTWLEMLEKPLYGVFKEDGVSNQVFYKLVQEKINEDNNSYDAKEIKLINSLIPNWQNLWNLITKHMPDDIQGKYIKENLELIYENTRKESVKFGTSINFETWMSIEEMLKKHIPEIYKRVVELNSSQEVSDWWKNKKLPFVFKLKDNIQSASVKKRKM